MREVYDFLTYPQSGRTGVYRPRCAGWSKRGADRVPDWLIDLMICVEVLFIKLPGLPQDHHKQDKLVNGALGLLADDPVLQASAERIDALLRLGYRVCNDEMHCDDSKPNAPSAFAP
ncbi:hypothetical protein [Micromonospora sp. NBC_01638]|uniref:hypothetical protein n=1 Tax=Micromonospora sp. NBC_01638 TaxID=2975982 RepID=UPI00386FEF0A|nr:hypothetical protein OG811_22850 [Micromonospora sp. NBC_01638]